MEESCELKVEYIDVGTTRGEGWKSIEGRRHLSISELVSVLVLPNSGAHKLSYLPTCLEFIEE